MGSSTPDPAVPGAIGDEAVGGIDQLQPGENKAPEGPKVKKMKKKVITSIADLKAAAAKMPRKSY